MPDEQVDILGFGAVAVDDRLYVDQYPVADTKVEVRDRERRCGGLTAVALVAAARLGARCAYCGTLGTDELSDFAVQYLDQHGVDTSRLVRRDGARPIHSVVIVDEAAGTRNIFFDARRFEGADPRAPSASLIRRSRALLVDHYGVEGMIRVARIGREAGIPVVADFEWRRHPDRFWTLLDLVDHLIVSHDFAVHATGKLDPRNASRELWTAQREVVIITCGADGVWYAAEGQDARHYPAFSVQARDTTGCGDVFHGAYAAALVRGLGLTERLRFAAAAAALTAAGRAGPVGAPTSAMVGAFLEDRADTR